jgi:hypothetical protein
MLIDPRGPCLNNHHNRNSNLGSLRDSKPESPTASYVFPGDLFPQTETRLRCPLVLK